MTGAAESEKTPKFTSKGAAISGGTVVLAPIVPFVWNKVFPDWPMSAEVAASAAGVVGLMLGFVYAIILDVLKKYNIDPTD